MNLYKVEWIEAPDDYDIALGVVCCAVGPNAARLQAASTCGDEGEKPWLDPKKTTVKTLGLALESTEEGVILRSFKAG